MGDLQVTGSQQQYKWRRFSKPPARLRSDCFRDCHLLVRQAPRVNRARRQDQDSVRGALSENWGQLNQCLRRITLRQLVLVSSAETSFEALAIARAKSLPSGGKLGRRNWRLRSPTDRQFHSAPGTSEEGNAGPTHDVLLPAHAET